MRKIGALKKEIILSTGMAYLGEIEDALNVLTGAGTELKDITVLHCDTEYPTPMQDVNLNAMQTIKSAFPGVHVGYSDHTEGIEVPIARKSIVAAKNIQKGESFTEENLTVKRPGTGISPMRWDEMLKMKALRNFNEDEIIDL